MVAQHVRVAERQDREIAAGERDVGLVRVVHTEPCTAAHDVVEADAARPSRKGQAPRGAADRERPAGLLQTNRGEHRAESVHQQQRRAPEPRSPGGADDFDTFPDELGWCVRISSRT